jgi:hypothetical protein
MTKQMGDIQYDLEDRTFEFARGCRFLIRKLRKDLINVEDFRQLIRSSGSVGVNYIEANEALSKKIFCIELKFAERNRKNLNIGYAYYFLILNPKP